MSLPLRPGGAWRAAEDMKPGAPQPDLPADAGEATIATLDKLRNSSGSLPVAKLRKRLQIAMQQDAAVFRTEARPARGRACLVAAGTCSDMVGEWYLLVASVYLSCGSLKVESGCAAVYFTSPAILLRARLQEKWWR